ncbi:unnamed protein product [Brassica rapa subsp. trilocularis]
MGDSVPLKLALPELKYPIGSQPKEKSAINQYSGSDYISIVKSILKPDEMIRVRGSFLGPVMKLSERGLKLSAKIVYAILTRSIRFNWELLKGRSHKLSDVVDQLRNTREDASEERICLAMLILVESILLRKSKGGSFPLEYAKNAQDMTYPWGKEAYIVLLKSIQNAVANHLENKSKFELQGYPLVFLLWILESIPLLRDKFSKCVPTVEVPGPTYLCEKYTEVENPSLDRVLQVEADTKVSFSKYMFLKDDISIEDKYSDELETVKDVTKKGYKITADDWENRCVDTFDTLDALIQMMANKETGQASTPIDEDSVNEKVNRIITVMEENLKSMKDRMSLLEEENIHLRARVSELEGNNNVFPTNVTQKVEVSRRIAHFQIGAEVEILSTDDEIWYPGKVVDLKLCEGLEELTVEYTTLFTYQHNRLQKLQDTITADKIRPATPTSDQKSFEMMDKVEAFYNNGWSSGQISMVLGDNTYSVCLYTSMETILFKHSDLRIHREWKDGVWKIADKVKPDKKRKAAASSQNTRMDNVFLRRSERVTKQSRDTKTPFKSDRNPALTVIPEIIPAVDPFSTPAEHKLSRLQNWMTLKPGIHETSLSINDNKIRKSFFQSMENAKKDLKKEHIDGAFAMLNCRRNENAAWFHNYKIPKACFLPMEFLHCLLSDDLAYKKEKVKGKKIFNDIFKDTVRGKVYPEKTWGEDVDVVYGITLGKKSNVWIGMEIHLKKKRITVYDCFQKESNNIDIPQVKKLAVLITNLLVESSGDEVDKVKMIPFEIEQAQGLPKTKHPFNCGIFLVKILECQSLKIGDMTKINDDNALELRRTLSCEIFNQFVDESFGK